MRPKRIRSKRRRPVVLMTKRAPKKRPMHTTARKIAPYFKRSDRGPQKRKAIALGLALLVAGFFIASYLLHLNSAARLDTGELIPVMNTETFCMGYMNASGKIAIDTVYEYAGAFINGRAVVRLEKSGQSREGTIDRQGRTVIPLAYESLTPCGDGTFIASIESSEKILYGWIDPNGETLLPLVYDFLAPFKNGRAFAQKDGAWLVVDKTGGVVHKLSGVSLVMTGFTGDGLVPFTTEGSDLQTSLDSQNWGYLKTDGSVAIAEQFLWATGFDGGRALAAISKDGKPQTVLIDTTGKILKTLGSEEFESGFSDGIAIGLGDKGFGAIDTNGNWIVLPQYPQVAYRDGVITVQDGGSHCKFLDRRGSLLLEWKYPCSSFGGGRIFYTKGGKTYLMDISGKTFCEVPSGYAITQ